MGFKFSINKYYLLVHALKSNISPFDGWVELPNKLWKISDNAYWFLFNPFMHDKIFTEINNENIENFFANIINDSKKIFSTAFKSKEFLRLYKETEKYLEFLKKEWEGGKEKIITTTEKIIGEKFPDTKIDVLITHPKLHNGVAFLELNTVCWGHPEDWENYSMVYLIHEALHLVLDKKFGRNNLTHAIIELISDQELRIKLNNGGIYFRESGENVGHDFLRKLIKIMLPHWKKYLKKQNKNIENFYKEMANLSEVKKLLEHK